MEFFLQRTNDRSSVQRSILYFVRARAQSTRRGPKGQCDDGEARGLAESTGTINTNGR
jgi:hypothetical protein